MQLLIWIMILVMLIVATHFDIKARKIPNCFNLAFGLMGFTTVLLVAGVKGALNSLVGVLIPVIALMPLFALRVIGAGDIKLISAIGAFVGTKVFLVAIYSFLSCGAYGLGLMIFRLIGEANERKRIKVWVLNLMSGNIKYVRNEKCTKVAFSVFVLCGVVIYMLRHGEVLFT